MTRRSLDPLTMRRLADASYEACDSMRALCETITVEIDASSTPASIAQERGVARELRMLRERHRELCEQTKRVARMLHLQARAKEARAAKRGPTC